MNTLANEKRRFLKKHETYRTVDNSEYEDILRWANDERYITLYHHFDQDYYDEHLLTVAIIWAFKCNKINL